MTGRQPRCTSGRSSARQKAGLEFCSVRGARPAVVVQVGHGVTVLIRMAGQASIPSPKSAARRRGCHVVRGASTHRASGKRTRPVPAVVRPVPTGKSSAAGLGMFRSVTVASLVTASVAARVIRLEITETGGAGSPALTSEWRGSES